MLIDRERKQACSWKTATNSIAAERCLQQRSLTVQGTGGVLTRTCLPELALQRQLRPRRRAVQPKHVAVWHLPPAHARTALSRRRPRGLGRLSAHKAVSRHPHGRRAAASRRLQGGFKASITRDRGQCKATRVHLLGVEPRDLRQPLRDLSPRHARHLHPPPAPSQREI